MGTIVSQYIDFETGADGDVATASNMGLSTHPASPGGTYHTFISGVETPLATTKIRTAGQRSMVGEVTTGGLDYIDVGTRGLAYDHLVNPEEQVAFDFDTPVSRASAGFMFMTTMAYQNFDTFSMFSLYSGGGDDFAVFNWESFNAGDHSVRAHTALGTSPTNIPILKDVWYWITLVYIQNLEQRINVYDITTFPFTQVGVTSTLGIGDWSCAGYNFGKVGGSASFPAAFGYYDNILIDNVNGAWPLMPSPGDAPQFNFRKQERRPRGFAPGIAR